MVSARRGSSRFIGRYVSVSVSPGVLGVCVSCVSVTWSTVPFPMVGKLVNRLSVCYFVCSRSCGVIVCFVCYYRFVTDAERSVCKLW